MPTLQDISFSPELQVILLPMLDVYLNYFSEVFCEKLPRPRKLIEEQFYLGLMVPEGWESIIAGKCVKKCVKKAASLGRSRKMNAHIIKHKCKKRVN